jgi:rfaE bifunctional protein nucleotidyltransferase chain/domain
MDNLQIDSATALAQARLLPRPMVFTHGVFDLLHAGHVRLLSQARLLGASLVVAVHADASVRQLGKGPHRPWVPQHDRLALVSALKPVSLALLLHEREPSALLEALQPELYVKGGDHDLEALPEARQVLAWGGRALVLPLLAGRSTRGLEQRVMAAASGTLAPPLPHAA